CARSSRGSARPPSRPRVGDALATAGPPVGLRVPTRIDESGVKAPPSFAGDFTLAPTTTQVSADVLECFLALCREDGLNASERPDRAALTCVMAVRPESAAAAQSPAALPHRSLSGPTLHCRR